MDKVVFNTRDITGNKKVKVELELDRSCYLPDENTYEPDQVTFTVTRTDGVIRLSKYEYGRERWTDLAILKDSTDYMITVIDGTYTLAELSEDDIEDIVYQETLNEVTCIDIYR